MGERGAGRGGRDKEKRGGGESPATEEEAEGDAAAAAQAPRVAVVARDGRKRSDVLLRGAMAVITEFDGRSSRYGG